jgi:hypothetical protein
MTTNLIEPSLQSQTEVLRFATDVARLADRIRGAGRCPSCNDLQVWLRAEKKVIRSLLRRRRRSATEPA